MYTDTNSLILSVSFPPNDPAQGLVDYRRGQYLLREHMDLSNIPDDHPMFTSHPLEKRLELQRIKKSNRKVPGKFKDELCGKTMVSFVGLKPKLYSCKMSDGSESHRAKGVKRCVELSHTDYLDVGQSKRLEIMRQQTNFKSSRHEVFLQKVTKKTMDAYYDKRFVLANHSTLAFGNKRLRGVYRGIKALH